MEHTGRALAAHHRRGGVAGPRRGPEPAGGDSPRPGGAAGRGAGGLRIGCGCGWAVPARPGPGRRAAGSALQYGVQDPVALDKVAFDSFRVRLRDPRQFPTLYGRLCSGRWTFSTKPVCKPGVSFVIANPRSVYYGLER